MRKISLVWMVLAAAPMLFAAGGDEEAGAGSDADSGAELLIWADETRAPVLEDIGAEFTAAYGVPIVVQQLGFGDIRDNAKVAIPAGEGPDILINAHDALGELVESGIVAPIDLGGKESAFVDTAIDAFSYDGELYGMPYALENVALFYNPDLVAQVPEDWEAVRELSARIQSSGRAEYGFLRQEGDPYHFFPIQTAFGGYVFGRGADGSYDPGDVGIDSAGSIEAARWLGRMVQEGLIPAGIDWDTYHSLFETGRAAMIITGPWALDRLDASGVNYRIAPLPGGGRPFLGVQGFMVSAFSENRALAAAFLTEFAATTEVMMELFERGGRAPAYRDALALVDDERVAAFAEAGMNGLPMPAIPEMSAVWTAWGDAVTLIMLEEVEAAEGFRNAAAQIRTLIAGE